MSKETTQSSAEEQPLPVLKKPKAAWYVFYTKSRSEKKTRDQVRERGFDVYLPLVEEMRQWSDRKKKVEVPLFRSYIFVRCKHPEIQELLQWVPGLVATVRHNGGPATIREKEIEMIDRFINTGLRVQAESDQHLAAGDQVKVMGGPLEGMEGEVLQQHNGEFFIVRIPAINQYLKVQVNKDFLKKV